MQNTIKLQKEQTQFKQDSIHPSSVTCKIVLQFCSRRQYPRCL